MDEGHRDQLSLLANAEPRVRLREAHARATRLVAQLPTQLRFGMVGWAHPHWAGEVFAEARPPADLLRDGLLEYGRHPLLRAVLWQPPDDVVDLERDVRYVAAQMPEHLHCLVEVPKLYTTPRVEGRSNPRFLDAKTLARDVVAPCWEALGDRLATFLLRFPPALASAGITPASFAARLEQLAETLPEDTPVGCDLRDPAFLSLEYARVLATRGISHVLAGAADAPPLAKQAEVVPSGPLLLVRLANCDDATELLAAAPALPTYVIFEGTSEAPSQLLCLAEKLAERVADS